MKKYFQVSWSIKDLAIIASITVILVLAAILGIHFSGVKELIEKSDYKIYYLSGLFLVQSLILLLPLLIYTWKKHKLDTENLGFTKIKPARALLEGLKGYLIYLLITYLIITLVIFTGIKIPGYQLQESIFEIFGTKTIELIVTGIIVVIIAPVIEEVFFRGFLLRTVSDHIGLLAGNIVTAAVFAVFHLQWQSIIPIFILGLIMNQIVIKNRSIWPAIVFHVLNNGLAFLLQILVLKDIIQIEKVI
ncbi:MAG: CPBP family intramembrane glutamic endopeptidase [Candidatus Gracilibacteria bacterium]|jgi:hypothetical protein